jgi:hypothetical protein
MAYEVTEHFVHQFGRGIDLLTQQKESRLRKAVRVISGIVGKTASFDQIGVTTAQEKATRHGPTPLIEAPHHRRFLRLTDYEQGIALDKEDQIRMLNDPTNTYSMSLAAAFGRKMDDVIVAAMVGTASTGETGTGSEAFDTTGYQIAAGGTGLDLPKLLGAKQRLDAAEKPEEGRFCLINAKQLKNLLDLSEVGSFDYNSVKALVRGEVDTFLGFEFIRAERTLLSGAEDRILFWQKNDVVLGVSKDSTSRIGERPDLSYLTQVYHCMTIGATRGTADAVVDALCV